MAEECCSQADNFMILACSECANGGQLANQTAAELSMEGHGKLYRLADIGSHGPRLSAFIQSAKDASFIIAVDGCSRSCAKKILENAELPIENYLVVKDRGTEKDKDLNLKIEIIDKFKASVKNSLGGKVDSSLVLQLKTV
jgi:uncharacterized metal-binding protein